MSKTVTSPHASPAHDAPPGCVMVIFGASGDLTHRKLLPAIFQLWCRNRLAETSSVVGFARSQKTDQTFRDELRRSTSESLSCMGRAIDDEAWAAFASRIFYHPGRYDDGNSW